MVDTDGGAAALLTLNQSDRDALAQGKVLVADPQAIWPDGRLHLQVAADPAADDATTFVVPGAVASGTVRVYLVLPQAVARDLRITTTIDAVVASTTRMPTDAEQQRAEAALDALPLSWTPWLEVERGYVSHFGLGLLALVVAALVVALAGSLTAVGLAAAEGRADAATLLAVGAPPAMRRRVAAGQAAVVVGLGAALAVLSGLLIGCAMIRLQMGAPLEGVDLRTALWPPSEDAWALVLPWPYLGAIVIGIPVVTVLIAYLTARTRLQLARRLTD